MPSMIINGELTLQFKLANLTLNQEKNIEIVIKGSEFLLEESVTPPEGSNDNRQNYFYIAYRYDYDLDIRVELTIYVWADGSISYEIEEPIEFKDKSELGDEYQTKAYLINQFDNLEIEFNPNFPENDEFY
ncbi:MULTISPECIES: hypothetical protein [Gilliamella]|uniref:Uncharacterized protein n=1 Tax=Gilliamella apis TaxID=1970738 RepID=A0A242NU04_9GAMM|nr:MULTISPECIES: hypothetical protein [Gilliamella]MBI0114226.1 hypothetical protein [Gilliamella sp. W8123]MBI0117763.1 hypothetical protein [Gilliamella sp. W8129]OTQ49328.1 hypothetical protein B6D06_06920 [Gilliamella apis]